MNRLLKLFSLLLWPYSGYFGYQKQTGTLQKFRFARFIIRFFSIYLIFYYLWGFFHHYWEIPLFYSVNFFCNQILRLPIELPELNYSGELFIRLLDFIYYPKMNRIIFDIFIIVPLIISTSNINIANRARMVIIALIAIYVFQTLIASHEIFCWVLRSYQGWNENRINAYQIIDIEKIDIDMFFCLSRYVFGVCNLFPLFLWVLLVFFYKRKESFNLPWDLL